VAPLLFVGDLTYDLDGMRRGLVPGLGVKAQLQATASDVLELERLTGALAILPAHDTGTATRLAATGA
jgi:glyoxylase-like metal-dependent hydrolase (beta-lactamase superfamily II)